MPKQKASSLEVLTNKASRFPRSTAKIKSPLLASLAVGFFIILASPCFADINLAPFDSATIYVDGYQCSGSWYPDLDPNNFAGGYQQSVIKPLNAVANQGITGTCGGGTYGQFSAQLGWSKMRGIIKFRDFSTTSPYQINWSLGDRLDIIPGVPIGTNNTVGWALFLATSTISSSPIGTDPLDRSEFSLCDNGRVILASDQYFYPGNWGDLYFGFTLRQSAIDYLNRKASTSDQYVEFCLKELLSDSANTPPNYSFSGGYIDQVVGFSSVSSTVSEYDIQNAYLSGYCAQPCDGIATSSSIFDLNNFICGMHKFGCWLTVVDPLAIKSVADQWNTTIHRFPLAPITKLADDLSLVASGTSATVPGAISVPFWSTSSSSYVGQTFNLAPTSTMESIGMPRFKRFETILIWCLTAGAIVGALIYLIV